MAWGLPPPLPPVILGTVYMVIVMTGKRNNVDRRVKFTVVWSVTDLRVAVAIRSQIGARPAVRPAVAEAASGTATATPPPTLVGLAVLRSVLRAESVYSGRAWLSFVDATSWVGEALSFRSRPPYSLYLLEVFLIIPSLP